MHTQTQVNAARHTARLLRTETRRALARIAAAKWYQNSVTILLAPERRSVVEWNLRRMGFKVEECKWDLEMSVIRW